MIVQSEYGACMQRILSQGLYKVMAPVTATEGFKGSQLQKHANVHFISSALLVYFLKSSQLDIHSQKMCDYVVSHDKLFWYMVPFGFWYLFPICWCWSPSDEMNSWRYPVQKFSHLHKSKIQSKIQYMQHYFCRVRLPRPWSVLYS